MKSIKKTIAVILAAVVLAAVSAPLLTSCGSDGAVTLNVYNWGEYISDGSEDSFDTNAEFEKWYFENYGKKVKVNYTTYASNEDMYAKLKSGAVKYDIIVPSDYMIELMIEEDMLEEINFANIPNYRYIADEYRGLFYDPDDKYSVPYTYGMVGIIYNTSMVEGTPESWNLMWDENYRGKILNFNNPRDAFGTAMYRLGIDVNTTSHADWDAAYEALKEQKPLKFFTVDKDRMHDFARAAKAHGLLFCPIRDKMDPDHIEIAILQDDASKANRIIDKLQLAIVDTGTAELIDTVQQERGEPAPETERVQTEDGAVDFEIGADEEQFNMGFPQGSENASPSEPFSDSSKSFANSLSPRADQLRAKGERPSVRMELSDITAYLRRKVEPPKDRMPKMPVKIKRKEKTL